MKSLKAKVGIVVIAAAVLLVGVLAGAKVIDYVKKARMTPAEYYQYVETKNRDNMEDFLSGYYDALRESFSGDSYALNSNMKLEVSDTAKAMLSMTGIDFSGVENLELDMTSGQAGKEYSNRVTLRGNDSDLVTVKRFTDLENNKIYCQIPELSEAYLDLLSEEDEEETETSATGALLQAYDLKAILIPTDDVKDIYERYTNLLIQSAKNVEKSEGGCEAEGISEEADKYTITMDGAETVGLLKDILTEVKSDGKLSGVMEALLSDSYDAYIKALDKALEKLDSETDAKNKLQAVMEVQITSDEQIIGRNLILKDEDGKQSEISLLCPRDNEKFGLELLVVSDGTEYLNLHGSGTEKKGIINAEFALSLDESLNKSEGTLSSLENLLKIELEDYDISGLAKGEVSGTVTYSTESMAQLANYSLKVQGEGNMKKSTAKITVLAGKDTFATIDMTSTVSDKVESTKPTDSDTIYDAGNVSDMEKYQSEMDLPALIEDIQSKLGIDLSGLLYMGLL